MALDLERCAGVASTSEVGEWVESLASTELSKRAALMAAIEGSTPTRPSARVPVAPPVTKSEMPTNPALRAPAAAAEASKDGPHSDVSHVAVAPTLPRPPRPWGRIAVLASSSGVVLVAALIAVSARSRRPQATPDPAAHLAPAEVSPAAVPSADQAPALLQGHPPDPNPPISDVASSNAGKDSSPTLKPHAVTFAPPRPQSKAQKPDCTPPFTVDDKGHKHYKAACL
jgi:serine/threonine-protein kinase